MGRLLIWWGVNALSLFIVASILPGVKIAEGVGTLIFVALIIGLINALLRPIFYLASCGFIILTLGLVIPILNALLLLLADRLVGDAFTIDSFLWAILAAILMGILNAFFSSFFKNDKEEKEAYVHIITPKQRS